MSHRDYHRGMNNKNNNSNSPQMQSHYPRGKALKNHRKRLRMKPAEVVAARRPKHFVLIAEGIRRTYEQIIMDASKKAHFHSNPEDDDDDVGNDDNYSIVHSNSNSIVEDSSSPSALSDSSKRKQIYVTLPRSPVLTTRAPLSTEVSD